MHAETMSDWIYLQLLKLSGTDEGGTKRQKVRAHKSTTTPGMCAARILTEESLGYRLHSGSMDIPERTKDRV